MSEEGRNTDAANQYLWVIPPQYLIPAPGPVIGEIISQRVLKHELQRLGGHRKGQGRKAEIKANARKIADAVRQAVDDGPFIKALERMYQAVFAETEAVAGKPADPWKPDHWDRVNAATYALLTGIDAVVHRFAEVEGKRLSVIFNQAINARFAEVQELATKVLGPCPEGFYVAFKDNTDWDNLQPSNLSYVKKSDYD